MWNSLCPDVCLTGRLSIIRNVEMCFNHINWSTSQTQQFHVHAKGLLAGVYRCIFAASVQVLHSHYSPILNKAIISPSHNTIFYFTHRFSRLFMASYQISPLPPSLLPCLSPSSLPLCLSLYSRSPNHLSHSLLFCRPLSLFSPL